MESTLCQEERMQLITERRKQQTEMENKKRQLEDERRALQHLKSKALRERWLLDGAAGPEHDEVKRQLEQDEAKTRILEETINSLEQELLSLETGCETRTRAAVSSGPIEAVEVKSHGKHHQDEAKLSDQEVKEVKVHRSPGVNKPTEEMKREVKVHRSPGVNTATEEMKRALYSVSITVERDKLTGETRVLSSNTTLPVDFSQQGVKVYEDEQKVVHEMNGEDGIQMLSSSEVDELLHKADEAFVTSQTVELTPTRDPPPGAAEIPGVEAGAGGEAGTSEASAENPVTMVFMGYQSVEDEDETKRLLGLRGTVKAELVLIDESVGVQAEAPPPAPPKASKPPEMKTTVVASNVETEVEVKKKQPSLQTITDSELRLSGDKEELKKQELQL